MDSSCQPNRPQPYLAPFTSLAKTLLNPTREHLNCFHNESSVQLVFLKQKSCSMGFVLRRRRRSRRSRRSRRRRGGGGDGIASMFSILGAIKT